MKSLQLFQIRIREKKLLLNGSFSLLSGDGQLRIRKNLELSNKILRNS